MTKNEMTFDEATKILESYYIRTTCDDMSLRLRLRVRRALNFIETKNPSKAGFADILGWEEGVEYHSHGGKYKVEDGSLKVYDGPGYRGSGLNPSLPNLEKLRRAKKVEEPRYRIPLPGLVTSDGEQQYLSYNDGTFFASRLNPDVRQAWKEKDFIYIPEEYRDFPKEKAEE